MNTSYNVLTLLLDLSSQDGNYIDISHEDFKYNRIGDERVIEPTESGYTPKFTDTSKNVRGTCTTLKFDEDRANVSILVKRTGTVNLPPNEIGFSESFDTHIWRNYTIIRDGILNVYKLPVILSKATHDLFTQLEVISEPFKVNHTYVIDLTQYPLIDKSELVSHKVVDLFQDSYNLHVLRTHQKYLNTLVSKPEVSVKFSALYGDEGASFLKECGITEGGFSPKTVTTEKVDYSAKVLEVKLAGLSSIPKVEDVKKAIADNKKLTVSQEIMKSSFDKFKDTDYESEIKSVKESIKNLLNKISLTKFDIIVGGVWFSDLDSFNDVSKEMDFSLSKMIKCTVCLTDKKF
jgi:hypothetical protein